MAAKFSLLLVLVELETISIFFGSILFILRLLEDDAIEVILKCIIFRGFFRHTWFFSRIKNQKNFIITMNLCSFFHSL